jgi:hypothetical protein
MPAVEHQDLLRGFDRGKRIVVLGKKTLPDRSADANKPAALVFQPAIERRIKTVEVLEQHLIVPIQKFRRDLRWLSKQQCIDLELRATQR